MAEQMPDYRETAHDLASMSGVDLTRARPATVRTWEARGLALQALALGDMAEAQRVMGMASDHVMDFDVALEIAATTVARLAAQGWSRDRILTSLDGGRAHCGRGFYLFREGLIAVCYFPMSCITDMNGRGYHFNIARDLLNQREPSTVAPRRPVAPHQLEMFT